MMDSEINRQISNFNSTAIVSILRYIRKTTQLPKEILSICRNLKLKNIFNASILPIILSISILATMMVLFRMKRIELDYKYYEINKDIDEARYENKELKAYKAKLLSVKNLNLLAKKYQMERPKEKQIIVIK
ncbi:MAG: hypothetical protein HQK49_08370 [Oligoflexia bacterium]|nr:hypothetical protein [Oligoflexia bacterium]